MKKQELRIIFKQKRLELPGEVIKVLDRQLLATLQGLDYRQVSFFHVYLPIRKWKECDTQVFVAWLRKAYPSIQVVVSKSDFETGLLRHFVLDEHTIVAENAWGIPEPLNEQELIEINPQQVDAVLVPLLVCDRYGNRLGYGKGFYDRFLKECRPDVLKIGVSYFEPIDERILTDEWDMPLDRVICPSGVVEFGG